MVIEFFSGGTDLLLHLIISTLAPTYSFLLAISHSLISLLLLPDVLYTHFFVLLCKFPQQFYSELQTPGWIISSQALCVKCVYRKSCKFKWPYLIHCVLIDFCSVLRQQEKNFPSLTTALEYRHSTVLPPFIDEKSTVSQVLFNKEHKTPSQFMF